MKITYKKTWFNPLYFIIKQLLKEGVSEFYIYGGKSSSKTVSICQTIVTECFKNNEDALIYRKESATIETTTKNTVDLAVQTTRLHNAFKKMDREFRSVNNDRVIFRGLDKEGKIKGIENFAWMFWDELDQFDFEEYSQAMLSFRGEVVKGFFGAWNPISEESWVKKKIVDVEEWHDHEVLKLPNDDSFVRISKDGGKALIKTNYKDNYWTVGSPCETYGYRDEKLISRYEKLQETDPKRYDVEVLGNWGVIGANDPYIQGFNENINVGKTVFNPRETVYLGFDYNVGNSCSVSQLYEYSPQKWRFHLLKEYKLDGGEGRDLQALCMIVAKDWGHCIIRCTGDASGNNSNALTQGSIGANMLMQKYMTEYIYKFHAQSVREYLRAGIEHFKFVKFSKNPDTDLSGWICSFLVKTLEKDFVIDSNCVIMRADLKKARRLPNGKLDKLHANANDYGHVMDTWRYIVHAFATDLWKYLAKVHNVYIPEHYVKHLES